MTVTIHHVDLGEGSITQLCRDLDGNVLAFIRWSESRRHGVAGGWYDLDRWEPHAFTVNGAALKTLYDQGIPSALGLNLPWPIAALAAWSRT